MNLANEYVDSGGSCWLPVFGRAENTLPSPELERTWYVGTHAFRRYFSVFKMREEGDYNVIGLYKCANYDKLNEPAPPGPPLTPDPDPDTNTQPENTENTEKNETGNDIGRTDDAGDDSDQPGLAPVIIILICLSIIFLGVIGWILYKRRRAQNATFATGATRLREEENLAN